MWLLSLIPYLLSHFSRVRLCDPIDGSPPDSPVPGILQARMLEWVPISSNAWKWKVKVKSLSRVRLFVTPWTADYQAPPSMGLSRQEYWSGVPLPSPLYVSLSLSLFVCVWLLWAFIGALCGFSSCGAQALEWMGSVVVLGCGIWA